jgi:hypothetical protein
MSRAEWIQGSALRFVHLDSDAVFANSAFGRSLRASRIAGRLGDFVQQRRF